VLALDQDEPGYLARDRIAAEAIERRITVRELPVAAYRGAKDLKLGVGNNEKARGLCINLLAGGLHNNPRNPTARRQR
jgi:hypothetical protein